MARKPRKNAPVFTLKITLRGCKPPIWRRVCVPGDISFKELHEVFQTTMGWSNGHLHMFDLNGWQIASASAFGGDEDMDAEDGASITLVEAIAECGLTKFRYEYDFGDGWEHDIVIESLEPADLPTAKFADKKLPVCLAGKRACPPEDIGGPWGYQKYLEIMRNPDTKLSDDDEERFGYLRDRDPGKFDLERVNRDLRAEH